MPDAGKMQNAEMDATDATDITIGALTGFLSRHKDKALAFTYGGRATRPGYHVTEVKAGQFSALDCGGNPEAWPEIFVQLLDAQGDARPMTAGKFAAILAKVTEHVALDDAAKLTFEVSDGAGPIELYGAGQPVVSGGTITVALSPRPASCKPRDRWLEAETRKAKACCASTAAGQA
jgi:Family of unknown function (DUF6428)